MDKTQKYKSLAIFAVILSACFVFNLFGWDALDCIRKPTARSIVGVNGFEIVWSLDRIVLGSYSSPLKIPLFWHAGQLYALEDSQCGGDVLVIEQTGELSRINFVRDHGIRRRIEHTDAYDGVLYVAKGTTGRVNPTTNRNAFWLGKVASYDVETNQMLWQTDMPGRVEGLFADEKYVVAGVTLSGTTYFVLDNQSGQVIVPDLQEADVYSAYSSSNYGDKNIIQYAIWEEAIGSDLDGRAFDVNNVVEGVDVLEKTLGRFPSVIHPIVIQGNHLVLRYGDDDPYWLRQPGQIKVFDWMLGETVWATEKDVVSNAATNSKYVFYVNEDAHVVARDIYTGRIVHVVAFGPADVKDAMPRIFIEATEEMVFVYFGDSRQLFALRLTSSDGG